MTNVADKWIEQVTPLPWLQAKAEASAQQLNDQPWPTRKTELWKYTSLKPIEKGNFDFRAVTQPSELTPEQVSIPQLDAFNLVFVNGHFNTALSNLNLAGSDLPAGLTIVDFANADDKQRAFIEATLNSNVTEQTRVFAHLSLAMLQQGLLIQLDKNVQIEKPIQITHYTTKDADQKGMQHRVLVHAEQHAEANIIELFYSDDSAHAGWMNQVTEIIQEAESHIRHYRLHKEQQEMTHTGAVQVSLQKQANFNSFMLGSGGKLKRVDYNVTHEGTGAECNLQGTYLVNQRQHFDLRTRVDHLSPRCTTNELFRGVVDDQARAVFSGEIKIHKAAQKSLAEMQNNNLLLSEQAQVNTKPALEIYADDVVCAHGATISQMNPKSLSYLTRRGISKAEAEVMLRFGFINEVLMSIKHEAIFDFIRPTIVHHFSKEAHLRRHLL